MIGIQYLEIGIREKVRTRGLDERRDSLGANDSSWGGMVSAAELSGTTKSGARKAEAS